MNKDELLNLLDDNDVRQKIFTIVSEPDAEEIFHDAPTPVDTADKIHNAPPTFDDEKSFALEDENRRLKEQMHAANQRADKAERQLDTLRGDNFQLRNSLAQSQQRARKFQEDAAARQDAYETERQRAQSLQHDLDNARGKNSRLADSLSQSEQTARALQDKLNEWQQTFDRERRRAQSLQRDLDDARDKISRLENSVTRLRESVDKLNAQLKTRFARGWELYQNYQRVGAHARQLLQGVFPREDFTSFICGGAQSDKLDTLWDVLRECVMGGRQEDAEILWEVFEYCIELVNAANEHTSYSILPVKVGDRFDSDVHSEAPGSRAQGRIANIFLPGYQNDYNGRVARKSIVQVS